MLIQAQLPLFYSSCPSSNPSFTYPSCPLVLLYSFISFCFLQMRTVLCCCNNKHFPPRTPSPLYSVQSHPLYWVCPASKHTLLVCLLPSGSSCKLFTLTPFHPPPSPYSLISPALLFFLPFSFFYLLRTTMSFHFIPSNQVHPFMFLPIYFHLSSSIRTEK